MKKGGGREGLRVLFVDNFTRNSKRSFVVLLLSI